MLTRLRVAGFKNLADVDVRLGPFTCIAGPNGVGKSNLFDAIAFLSALARLPLLEAARSVRAEGSNGDVRSLFARVGERVRNSMRLEADMIIPEYGADDLGQEGKAGITFVRYAIELAYVPPSAGHPLASLEILAESLEHINRSKAGAELAFTHKKEWLASVIRGRRTSPYISTSRNESKKTVIQLHADSEGGEGGGRPRPRAAETLPRTVLSSVNNAVEHRTAVLVRKEMMSWTQLRLEPSKLRAPDPFATEPGITSNGAHMPATLYALQHGQGGAGADIYARVARRVADLVDRVDGLSVEKDDRRQQFELLLTDRSRTPHYARSLSDGTLRFLALAILDEDPAFRPLVCLEEPENGIHPTRIPAMLQLLRDIAVDTSLPVSEDNPLRQVLINTHSPWVVGGVESADLLVADSITQIGEDGQTAALRLSALSGTWRARAGEHVLSRGRLLEYLSPPPDPPPDGPQRIFDRPEVQLDLFGRPAAAE
jgi:predicted ATPase